MQKDAPFNWRCNYINYGSHIAYVYMYVDYHGTIIISCIVYLSHCIQHVEMVKQLYYIALVLLQLIMVQVCFVELYSCEYTCI